MIKAKNKAGQTFIDLTRSVPEETRLYVAKKMQISDRIEAILKSRKWKQVDLARKLGIKESRVSNILAANQNMTLKTITRIEAVLGQDLIQVPTLSDSISTIGVETYQLENMVFSEEDSLIGGESDSGNAVLHAVFTKTHSDLKVKVG